jgi:hypothetical protein
LASEVHFLRLGLCLLLKIRVSHEQWVSPVGQETRGNVKRSTDTAVIEHEAGCAEQLSRFFPNIAAVRIPVQVTALRPSGPKLKEATVLEFGGSEFGIFLSTLPVEFDDRVRLERSAENCIADASVVAVQYHEGRKAVAVKFKQPCDWMTRA